MYYLIFIAAIFLGYSNGSNDNFKGVATLFGSETTDYKKAIRWGTFTTFLGSLASVFLAQTLIKNFSGKGLIPDHFLSNPAFAVSVALGAAATVILATRIGMPISTTHGIIGALMGSGLIAVGTAFNFNKLGHSFLLPLIASPVIAAVLSYLIYLLFTNMRKKSGIEKESCLCVGETQKVYAFQGADNKKIYPETVESLEIKTGTIASCKEQYTGSIVGISAQKVLDTAHFMSAGAVSFARGLNDTPKMAGLLLIISALNVRVDTFSVALAIAVGGLLKAKKVGETMSKKITGMNPGQGFSANLVTALLVTTASFNGLPVSTTHVSVGSLFGIGKASGKSNKKMIGNIVLSWILTLPVAAIISALLYISLTHFV